MVEETHYLSEDGKEVPIHPNMRRRMDAESLASELIESLPQDIRAKAHLPLINALHRLGLKNSHEPKENQSSTRPHSPFSSRVN